LSGYPQPGCLRVGKESYTTTIFYQTEIGLTFEERIRKRLNHYKGQIPDFCCTTSLQRFIGIFESMGESQKEKVGINPSLILVYLITSNQRFEDKGSNTARGLEVPCILGPYST